LGVSEVFKKMRNIGVYQPNLPSLAENEGIPIQLDVNGNQKSTLATALDKTNDSITTYPRGINCTIISTTSAVTIGGGVANGGVTRANNIPTRTSV
jgi:hypothetical protein